ncbi:MAG: nucleotidyltransferase domain-containing protein [Armatimonadota bacterium]|nr:nucleotidyltransferase domain-containing protein [Armatimonadota bacterium]
MDNNGLNYDALRRFATENVPGLIFATVSGAHLYGFPSPDSDVDLRGSYAAPLPEILGLERPKETREPEGIVEGREVEMVGHEIGKYLRLLVKPNGYVLEQIFSPLVVLTSPAHEEQKALAQAGLSRRLYYHYAGFARGEWREYQKPGVGKTVKRLLYIHRVLMTGITLLTEGVVEANIHRLNARFPLDLEPLLAMKTREKAEIAGDDGPYRAQIAVLFEQLDAGREISPLPETAPNRAALSDFLVRLRLSK